jgi:anti-sigma regulatory factor (Ser/Thr protein kinase)
MNPGQTAITAEVADPGAETHLAMFYGDAREYVDGVMRFLEPALDAGEPVAIAVPGYKAGLLQAQLGDHAGEVQMLDMCEVGRNPSRIIPAVEGLLARNAGRSLHYVGEPIWAGRSQEEIREATKHEALVNLAWRGAPIRVLCPYDEVGLAPEVLIDAQRTHPHLARGAETIESPCYDGPVIPDGCDDPFPEPPEDAVPLPFGVPNLYAVRSLVSWQAVQAGLDVDRTSDLVLAVDEVASNSIRHTNEGGLLRVWQLPGRIICQIDDQDRIEDPLAGRRLPRFEDPRSASLWMANQLCDLVEVRSGPRGSTIRVHTTLR